MTANVPEAAVALMAIMDPPARPVPAFDGEFDRGLGVQLVELGKTETDTRLGRLCRAMVNGR